jgi:hypothetical protein
VVEIMRQGKHPRLCQQAVDGTIRTALTSYGNKKVLNASNHALGALQLAHPLLASHHLSMSAMTLIRESAGVRGTLIKIVKGWQAKATKLLNRAPISWDKWQSLVRSLTSNDRTTKKWEKIWDPENGHVYWHDEEDNHHDLSSREVHMAWNANSLNQRFDSGDLINLLMAHNPTTISISEIKTSLIDFRDPEGLRHILKTLGYGFCAFNWCTQTQQNGTKRKW